MCCLLPAPPVLPVSSLLGPERWGHKGIGRPPQGGRQEGPGFQGNQLRFGGPVPEKLAGGVCPNTQADSEAEAGYWGFRRGQV